MLCVSLLAPLAPLLLCPLLPSLVPTRRLCGIRNVIDPVTCLCKPVQPPLHPLHLWMLLWIGTLSVLASHPSLLSLLPCRTSSIMQAATKRGKMCGIASASLLRTRVRGNDDSVCVSIVDERLAGFTTARQCTAGVNPHIQT